MKVKAPFRGHFSWQARWPPRVTIYAHQMIEIWFGEYEWDWLKCQEIPVKVKLAVRMGEVVVNHPDLQPDENGVGHIVFSPEQARQLAFLLQQKAHSAEEENIEKRRQEAEKIPVDRSAQALTNGSPVPKDGSHVILRSDGQQQGYVVLTPEERNKGFVRPYRDAYRHLKCGKITTMGRSIAETYARDPGFYTGTFCTTCGSHFPVGEEGEFVWYEMDGTTGPKVGT